MTVVVSLTDFNVLNITLCICMAEYGERLKTAHRHGLRCTPLRNIDQVYWVIQSGKLQFCFQHLSRENQFTFELWQVDIFTRYISQGEKDS